MTLIANVTNCDGFQREEELTAAQVAQHNADQIAADLRKKNETAAEIVKDAARQAVLDKLGLSADEVAALLS